MDFVRPDYLFSYWIFAWFLIYYFLPIPLFFKKYANPLLGFLIGLIENIGQIFLYSTSSPISNTWFENNWIIIYFIMILLFKMIPIYILSNHKILWYNDTLVLLFLFLIYNFYLFLNNTNIIEVYKNTIKSIQTGENKTPFFYFVSLFFNL